MKTKKINKKLELKKETISILNNIEMAAPKGGAKYTWVATCTTPPNCNTNEDYCTFWCTMQCA